jgi:hypothetical protein
VPGGCPELTQYISGRFRVSCPLGLFFGALHSVVCLHYTLHSLQLSDGRCIWDLEFVKSLLYFIKKGDFESPYMCSNDNDA